MPNDKVRRTVVLAVVNYTRLPLCPPKLRLHLFFLHLSQPILKLALAENGEAPTDLDRCNSHFGPTPEFPEGIQHYHLTETAPYSIECYRIHAMDLDTHEMSTVWQVQEGAFVSNMALSPDGSTLALSYIPAPEDDLQGYDSIGIFVLDVTLGREPAELLWPNEGEVLGHPTWSADGMSLYFVRFAALSVALPQLERYDFDTQEVHIVAHNATTPAPSPGDASVAFVSIDPDTDWVGLSLSLDGDEKSLVTPGLFHNISNVQMGPGGDWVYFTALRPALETTKHAAGHSTLSDLWRVSTHDGAWEEVALIGLPIHSSVISSDKPLVMHFSTPTGVFGLVCDELEDEVQSVYGIKSRALRDLSWASSLATP